MRVKFNKVFSLLFSGPSTVAHGRKTLHMPSRGMRQVLRRPVQPARPHADPRLLPPVHMQRLRQILLPQVLPQQTPRIQLPFAGRLGRAQRGESLPRNGRKRRGRRRRPKQLNNGHFHVIIKTGEWEREEKRDVKRFPDRPLPHVCFLLPPLLNPLLGALRGLLCVDPPSSFSPVLFPVYFIAFAWMEGKMCMFCMGGGGGWFRGALPNIYDEISIPPGMGHLIDTLHGGDRSAPLSGWTGIGILVDPHITRILMTVICFFNLISTKKTPDLNNSFQYPRFLFSSFLSLWRRRRWRGICFFFDFIYLFISPPPFFSACSPPPFVFSPHCMWWWTPMDGGWSRERK